MDEEDVVRHVMTGAERWAAIKARQYTLRLPLGVYPSDLSTCVLLAELPGTEDAIVARIEAAAALLVRLRADRRVSGALGMGGDVTAILALASIPGDTGELPVAIPVASPVVEPAPCQRCAAQDRGQEETIAELRRQIAEYADRPAAEPVAAGASVAQIPAVGACEHVGSDGKCADCTGDRIVDCSGCETSVVVAQVAACKSGADECGKVFCAACVADNLNGYGYCEDCNTLTCDGCNEDLDRGTEKHCPGDGCENDFCESCAPRLLNADGLCSACCQEDESDCAACGTTFIDSRLTQCGDEDCSNAYCDACKGDQLSAQGYCEDCDTLECSRCDTQFARDTGKDCAGDDCDEQMCASCAADLLNEDSLCASCADDDEEGECDGCQEAVIDSRLTDCAGDGCEAAFCRKCIVEYLGDNGLCSGCDKTD